MPETGWSLRLVLVPRRAGVTEIVDLSVPDAARLMDEIAHASRALKAVTACDKLNVAAIGNVVPQLHVQIVARRRSDPLWPKPVWGVRESRASDAAAFETFLTDIRDKLRI